MRFLLLWTLLSAVAAVIAWDKRRSPLLFFAVGMLLSPPVGIIAALIVPRRQTLAAPHSMVTRACPNCGAEVRVATTVCPRCSAALPPVIDADPL